MFNLAVQNQANFPAVIVAVITRYPYAQIALNNAATNRALAKQAKLQTTKTVEQIRLGTAQI